MNNFNKKVQIGRTKLGLITAEINYSEGRLSIAGEEGQYGAGQISDSIAHIKSYSEGWNAELAQKFREVWDEWHLNDMIAGSPAQMQWLKENPITFKYPETHYEKARDALTEAGLNPDQTYLKDGKPYRYGTAWLRVSVPEDVLQFLKDLP